MGQGEDGLGDHQRHAARYSWKYRPAKKGAYRMQALIAKTAAHTAATTEWLTFKVK